MGQTLSGSPNLIYPNLAGIWTLLILVLVRVKYSKIVHRDRAAGYLTKSDRCADS